MKSAQLFSAVPDGCAVKKQSDDVAYVIVPGKARGKLPGLLPKGIDRWMALRRTDYWMKPVFGTDWAQVPRRCQFIMGQKNDGAFYCLIPLVTADTQCYLQGDDIGLELVINRDLRRSADQPLLAVGIGDDAHALVERVMGLVADSVGGFRLRRDKADPAFMHYFGWCTWDAFYHRVSERKVRAGLKSFADKGVNCGFMILDDGWADTRIDFLSSFDAKSEKFPKGLATTIAALKKDFGLKSFGLWHSFESYWAGLDTEGKLAKHYKTLHSRAQIRPWLKEHPFIEIDMIDPADIASMYHTGGTTGTPKLAPHTHFNEAAMVVMVESATELKTGETTLCSRSP
jgi:raffinose synthase